MFLKTGFNFYESQIRVVQIDINNYASPFLFLGKGAWQVLFPVIQLDRA